MSKWYVDKGEQGDIVLSTRVRLARNLEEFPFPCRLDTASKIKVNEKVRDTLLSCVPELGLHYVTMDSLNREQAISLAERHLISPEFASVREGRALMLTEDETVGIMLCEEDHIRVQVMKAGLALMDCYVLADKIDSALDKKLNFAFDERLGYLTQCPTNLGTAMRASVMLHLPALRRSGQLAVLSSTISKLGLTLRGAYGEGRESRGDIYQLSNQITLGITEQAAIENLQSITRQLVTQERAAAERMCADVAMQDKIYRALGILKSARVLSCDEMMDLISLVRLGSARGILDIPIEKLNELLVNMQPATISAANGKHIDARQRDCLRADAVREALS